MEENIPVAKPVEKQTPSQPTSTPTEPTPSAGGKAIAALILGVLSLVCMGFLTGVPAIIIGRMELTDIKNGKSPKQGESIAKIGFVLGIIGTALTCLIFLGGVVIAIVSAMASNVNSIANTSLII